MTKKKTTKKKITKKKATKATKKKCRKGIGGAPTLYKPEYCQLLIDHMSQGLSYECFGSVVNVSKSTVDKWLKHQEFSDARHKAQAHYRKYWEELGKKGVNGEIKNFNAVAWIFNMKNRFLWRNEVVVKDERKVEAVTIELPNSKQAETITLNDGDYKDVSK